MYRNTLRRTGMALSGRASPTNAVGCEHPTLRDHIAGRFRTGMCWERFRGNQQRNESESAIAISAAAPVMAMESTVCWASFRARISRRFTSLRQERSEIRATEWRV